jgi:hypothetical protein
MMRETSSNLAMKGTHARRADQSSQGHEAGGSTTADGVASRDCDGAAEHISPTKIRVPPDGPDATPVFRSRPEREIA